MPKKRPPGENYQHIARALGGSYGTLRSELRFHVLCMFQEMSDEHERVCTQSHVRQRVHEEWLVTQFKSSGLFQ